MKQIYFNCLCNDLRRVRKLNERRKKTACEKRSGRERNTREKKYIAFVPTLNARRVQRFSGSASESDMLQSMQVSLDRHWLAVAAAAAVLLTQRI